MDRFRFRPRLRALALGVIGLGALLVLAGAVNGLGALAAMGGVGMVLGAAYLASPTWRLAVVLDDDGLEVGSPGRRRFRLAWSDVVRVVASDATTTCFVDGGAPERSFLVPGDGAPAPYDLERKPALYAAILARVPADRIRRVARLDEAAPA